MLPPPQDGNVYNIVPPGIGNPEAWGIVVAWDAWRTFAGQALTESLDEIQALEGIPA